MTSSARPALVVLALAFVFESALLLGGPSPSDTDDDLQFRSVRAAPDAPSATSDALILRWKPGVDSDAAQDLLHAAGAEVVGVPDAKGGWRLRLHDVVEGRIALAASPLVEAMEPVRGTPP